MGFGTINKVFNVVCFFARVVWCIDDIPSVSPSSEKSSLLRGRASLHARAVSCQTDPFTTYSPTQKKCFFFLKKTCTLKIVQWPDSANLMLED